MKKDTAPDLDIDVTNIPDAIPKAEPYSKGGNASPYVVWGKTYHVLDTHDGYSEEGLASWYGKKFHGHKTSNGEIYDMYTMTAAHKSLPIPSYAEVTNLNNGRKVVVRVNDRGPFHSDRIIDLSYAAAKKLGYKDKGTARVRVSSITVGDSGSLAATAKKPAAPAPEAKIISTPLPEAPKATSAGYYVQLGAFSDSDRAAKFLASIDDRIGIPLSVFEEGIGMLARHKVVAGPISTRANVEVHLETIKRAGFFGSFIVKK